ncbi:protein of unknown function DUF6593 [Abortiporus biennis]
MNLYFNPNDPMKTAIVSANGIPQYRISTSKAHTFGSPSTTLIQRPVENEVVAEILWKRGPGRHPVVRSNVFDGQSQEIEIREFLYKMGSAFSSTRFFLGNDDREYKWKTVKGTGQVLFDRTSRREIARFTQEVVQDGFFKNQCKWLLHIEPTDLDIDLIVLTFIVMEKRRRDREAEDTIGAYQDEDDQTCEGGCEVGSG